eukprot:1803595-Lingulodinium_polyedra.AAC.1
MLASLAMICTATSWARRFRTVAVYPVTPLRVACSANPSMMSEASVPGLPSCVKMAARKRVPSREYVVSI